MLVSKLEYKQHVRGATDHDYHHPTAAAGESQSPTSAEDGADIVRQPEQAEEEQRQGRSFYSTIRNVVEQGVYHDSSSAHASESKQEATMSCNERVVVHNMGRFRFGNVKPAAARYVSRQSASMGKVSHSTGRGRMTPSVGLSASKVSVRDCAWKAWGCFCW